VSAKRYAIAMKAFVLIMLLAISAEAGPVRMRVASFNVGATAGSLRRTERVEETARRLAAAGLDTVLLQGLPYTEDAMKVQEELATAGLPHSAYFPRGAGLLLISRWPIRGARFRTFKHAGEPLGILGGDYFGAKGMLIAAVESPRGPISVINVRMESALEDPRHDLVKLAQVVELAADLPPGTPLVMGGDLRLAQTDAELGLLLARGSLRLLPGPRNDHLLVRDGGGLRLDAASANALFKGVLRFPSGETLRLSPRPGLAAELRIERGIPRAPVGQTRRRLSVWAATRLAEGADAAHRAMRPLLLEGLGWLMLAAWMAGISKGMKRRRWVQVGIGLTLVLAGIAWHRGLLWLPEAAETYGGAVAALMRG
jgi:hypothetical protein